MPAPSSTPLAIYRFGNVELLPVERRLKVDGRDAHIGARALDVLLALIERRDRLVARDELLDLVWPDLFVEPNNLAVQVGALRKVVGPHAIATVPGRGYRFSAVVDEPARAAPPEPTASASTARQRTNLPEQLPPLIGRQDELRTVGGLIDTRRIVTITGSGGIGKTRLAQRLLHERRDRYRHGVCWIELAPVGDAATMPGAIAAALGIKLGAGERGRRLEAALAPLEILICLDNAEHLAADTGRLVGSLVAAAAGVRIVVTSQAPLHVSDEQVVRLDSLAIPSTGVGAEEALRYGAIDLFVQRARAADHRFAFDDAKAPAVIRLCASLDGLPLAIEFAAARAPMLGVDRILASLHRRLEVLKGGYRSAPARQQTMLAALDWSHHLLGDDERVVFRRLAVVAGSASLELVQAIVADPDGEAADARSLDRWAVVDALGGLIDRSLVAVLADDRDPDRPRYRLLETQRAYAAERLAEAGEVAILEERHARAVAALFEAARVERWSGAIGWDHWIDKFEADFENGRAAFAWALQADAFDLVLAMAPVLLIRTFARAGFDQGAMGETVDRLLSTRPVEPRQLHTRLQLIRLWARLDVPRVRLVDEVPRVLRLAEVCGDRFDLYSVECLRVQLLAQTRDLAALAVALARVDTLEDPAWPPIRLWLGAEARNFGALVGKSARATVETARHVLRIVRLAGHDGTLTAANLIDAELWAGEAASAAERGLALLSELADSRDVFGLRLVRVNTASALLAMDDVARALPIAIGAWEIARHYGSRGACVDHLALLCALEGRWPDAAALVGYADADYARRGTQRWPNEGAAHDRTVRLVTDALGADEFERLVGEGNRLSDAEVAVIAFPSA